MVISKWVIPRLNGEGEIVIQKQMYVSNQKQSLAVAYVMWTCHWLLMTFRDDLRSV